MKLWTYWMENDYSSYFEEVKLVGDGRDNRNDFEAVSGALYRKMSNGEILDYQVELRT